MSASAIALSLLVGVGTASARLPDSKLTHKSDGHHQGVSVRLVADRSTPPLSKHAISIPPGTLEDALIGLSLQTGNKLAFRQSLVSGINTSGLTGKFTAQAAITALLKGTQLAADRVPGAGFTIRPISTQIVQATELQGIVVYGAKTETDLQKTTTGVQVFTSEEIEESSIQDIDDVLDQTSNVIQRFGGEGFAIRGISNNSVVGNVGTSPLATLYIDGTPFNSFALRTGIEELWDVDQVEVFKGPQSTVFGRNALAGTVVVKTKDPEYRNTMKAQAGMGSQGTRGIAGTVNANLIDQTLAVRVSVDYNTTDGFNNNPTLGIDDQASSSNLTLRGKVLFEPSKAFSNVITLTYSDNKSGDEEVDQILDVRDRNFFGNIQGFENTKTFIVAVDSKLEINPNWYLKNILTYNRAAYESLYDADGSFNGTLNGTNAPGSQDSFFLDNTTKTFTEELRVHYEDDRLRAHLGAYYSRVSSGNDSGSTGGIPSSVVATQIDNAFPALGAFFPSTRQDLINTYASVQLGRDSNSNTLTTNYAGFGEISYDFTPFVTGYAGLRYDVEKFELAGSEVRTFSALPTAASDASCATLQVIAGFDGCAVFNGIVTADAAATANAPDVNVKSEAWLPMIGSTLNWTDDLSTSFTVKRGYRAGGGGTSLVSGTLYEFDPEFVWNYELAFRSQWFNKRLTANSNVFFMSWKDQQVFAPGPNGPRDGIVINAARSQSYGAELELYARPTDQFTLRGSVGYLRTEFVDFEGFNGNEFPNAPNWTIAAAARYQFDSGFYLQADANYKSRSFSDTENRPGSVEDARTLVNGRIGYKTQGVDAYLYSTNVFDVHHIEHQSGLTNTAKVGDGRFVGFRIKLSNE
ncbi:MAG: TonB-dependent receptor [Pseudomonadota bacterium]